VLIAAVSSVLLAAPGASIAAPPAPDDFSAADQYVESLPTSEGSRPARHGEGRGASLPSSISDRLGGPGGELLERIATSTDLGAPGKRLNGAKAKQPDVPLAAVSAIGESEGGGLLALLAALVLISGVVAGIATHRHHRNRQLNRDA
jgi:hypothetical protein